MKVVKLPKAFYNDLPLTYQPSLHTNSPCRALNFFCYVRHLFLYQHSSSCFCTLTYILPLMLISKLPQLYYIVEAHLILHYKLHPIHIPQDFLVLILVMTYAGRNLIYPRTCYLYVAYFSLNLDTILFRVLIFSLFRRINSCGTKIPPYRSMPFQLGNGELHLVQVLYLLVLKVPFHLTYASAFIVPS